MERRHFVSIFRNLTFSVALAFASWVSGLVTPSDLLAQVPDDWLFEDGFEEITCSENIDCSMFDSPPVCESPSACQGTQQKGVCQDSACVVQTVDNDSACSSGIQAKDCLPYLPVFCSGAENQDPPECSSSCTTDFDCNAGFYCDGQSQCVPLKSDGASCESGNECASGHCPAADRVCCSSACSANCVSCALPGFEGSCTFIPDGTDPDDDCGPLGVCDGGGLCRDIPTLSLF